MAQDMNRHFTLSALLKFTFPTICMMIFTSLYTVVDGFFVSNYIGKTALAAVNLAWPIIMILATVGLMTGTGGSALIAKTRGEGDDEQANRYFSMLVFFTIAVSLVLGALGQAAIVPAMQAFGADGPLLDSAVSYGRWLLGMLPFFALQFAFEVLFSTAGKPHYGFFVVVAGGVTNVVLDWLFICVLGWASTAPPSPRAWGKWWAAPFRWCISPGATTPASCGCAGRAPNGAPSAKRA